MSSVMGTRTRLKTEYLFLPTNHNITHGQGRPSGAETTWTKEVKLVEGYNNMQGTESAPVWVASQANNEVKIWGQVHFFQKMIPGSPDEGVGKEKHKERLKCANE